MTVTGMSRTDWENSALKDFGVTVTLNRVTRTNSAMYGSETKVYGANENITVIFCGEVDPEYTRDEEGQYKYVEPFIQAKIVDAIDRFDKITYNGHSYLIKSVEEVKIPFGIDEALFLHCPVTRLD